MRVGVEQGVPNTLGSATERPEHWSAHERATIYQRVVGAPGGEPGGAHPNRAFPDLFTRFVASVAQFSQQKGEPSIRRGPSLEAMRTALSELAAEATPRIDAAWGQRDQWSVIDRVNTLELGGATNTERYRTLAQSGGAILEWVASHGDAAAFSGDAGASLRDAAEQWVAASGAADDNVNGLAQPEAAQRVSDWSHALLSAVGPGDRAGGVAGKTPGATPSRLTALFAGAPGTGKTLAAHWLASSLGRNVLRVDLSTVVSKYIGETEKNLDRVFKDAARSGAVLLFDEADALLGKRTGVRDAHDRYANLEVNLLLQRIERHAGVTLLASNATAAIDPDLLERAKATVVTFPLPPR